MPRQLRKIQAFLELPRHFQKCQISSNACDIYIQFLLLHLTFSSYGDVSERCHINP
jgi:hypothetical protein